MPDRYSRKLTSFNSDPHGAFVAVLSALLVGLYVPRQDSAAV